MATRIAVSRLACLFVLAAAPGSWALAAERGPTLVQRDALAGHVAAGRAAVWRGNAPRSVRKLGSLRGGFVVGAVSYVARSAWRLLRIQLLVLAVVQVWPIPFVLFFYWLMHTWFGSEGTSMIAFSGIR